VRVYHFLSEHYGLENIQNRRLKIARIAELNDPFEFLARADSLAERAALRATKEEQSRKTGLLCFSRDWSNPVQWSHYADRHRGLCLGFDILDADARPVTYRKTPIHFDLARYRIDNHYAQHFAERMISSKFSDWSYEQEVRLYVRLDPNTETDGLYFYDFSNELRLAEVIVGAASSLTRLQLSTALGDLSDQVQKRKARMAFKSYRVVEQRDSGLWS
jgi:hypothetical protein